MDNALSGGAQSGGAQAFGPSYIGRKIVKGRPDERDGREGYFVQYPDGYTSWSPKAAFEEAYIELGNISHLPPFHQRMIGEHAMLSRDLYHLNGFIKSDGFQALDRDHAMLLQGQAELMFEYLGILSERLELLGTPVKPEGGIDPTPVRGEALANKLSLTPEQEQEIRSAGPGNVVTYNGESTIPAEGEAPEGTATYWRNQGVDLGKGDDATVAQEMQNAYDSIKAHPGLNTGPLPVEEVHTIQEHMDRYFPGITSKDVQKIEDDAVNSAGLTATEIQQLEAGWMDELARIAGIGKRAENPGGATLFRKKPVTVEAVRVERKMLWPDWFHEAVSRNEIATYGLGKYGDTSGPAFVEIKTLEGVMRGDEGDWIIKGVKGEFYPCKPDIFEATYGPADGGEDDRIKALINSPELDSFLRGVHIEAVHQVERWGAAHDRAKRPADWFWLVGYLAGKALHAAVSGDADKARHHCISTAAALYNWHCAISEVDVRMCPGRSDLAEMVDGQFPGEAKQVFDPTGQAVEYSATAEASKPTPQG